MTPKEYLSQATHLDSLINSKLSAVIKLRASLYSIKTEIKKDKIQTNSNLNFTDKVHRLMLLEDELNGDIDDLIDFKMKIQKEIDILSDNLHKYILINRYLNNESLYEIAEEMHYSYSYIRQVHGYALEEFKKAFPEKFK